VNAAANAVTRLLDGGRLRVYANAPQPPTANAGVPGRAILLVELPFSSTAFEPAVAGVAEANPIAAARAIARGEAQWFRAVAKSGRAIVDGSVGPERSGANLELPSITIIPGVEVLVTQLTYVQPAMATL
jgi:hypothetical protein